MRKGVFGFLLALAGLLVVANTASAQFRGYRSGYSMPFNYGSFGSYGWSYPQSLGMYSYPSTYSAYSYPAGYTYSYPSSGSVVYPSSGTVISDGTVYPAGTVVSPSGVVTSGYTSGYTPSTEVITSGYSVPYVGSATTGYTTYPTYGTSYPTWNSGWMPYSSGYYGGYGRAGMFGRRWR